MSGASGDASISAEQIKALRERTAAGILDCKKALRACDGDEARAIKWLREKGLAQQAKWAGRVAAEGQVGSYLHPGGKIGVMIEVNCATDFAARSEEFQALVRDLAMQVAASSPRFVRREEVPAEHLAAEREIFATQARQSGKPDAVIDKIVAGKLEKFYQEACLLEQPFIKDPEKSVAAIVDDVGLKIREPLSVRRFVRYQLGEGIERPQDDFASEVAAQVAAAHEAERS
jgi:elongation factor Ts